jgi:hypothetical protein
MRGEQESLKEFRNINEPVNVIQLEERTEPAPEDPEKEKKEDVVDMADLKRQLEFIKLK